MVGKNEGDSLNERSVEELVAILEEWEDKKEGRSFTPLRRKVFKKRLASVDTEDDGKGNLKSICFYNGKRFWLFYNRFEFITFLSHYQTKGKLYIICCNLEYDIINLFRDYWDLIELFYGARLIFAKLRDKKIYFMDSLNHYKLSVANQGEYISLPKLEFNPDNPEYVKRDAEITYQFAVRHQDYLNSIGAEMNYTSASSSLNLFKRMFLTTRIKKIPDEILDMVRNGYYGGRTEIFNLFGRADKNEKIYYYDINSLYPYVMKTFPYPVPDSHYLSNDWVDVGVIHCDIEYVEDMYIPYFPYRYEGKLVFPTGRLTGWWTSFELKYALDKKLIRIKKIYKAIGYKQTFNYFSSYVDFLYGMRLKVKDKDKHLDLVLKIMMNSLYGKFAERVESKKTFSEDGEVLETVLEKVYYPSHSNYIMSVYTTAYARTTLYEGLQDIVDKKGLLYYCDTDSIIYKGKEGLLDVGQELGQYKLEGTFKEAQFYLPKCYRMIDLKGKEYVKVKGVPSKFALEFIKRGYVEFDKPVKLRESMKRVDKDTYKPNVWLKVPKSFNAEYTKRLITQGNETTPIVLCDF